MVDTHNDYATTLNYGGLVRDVPMWYYGVLEIDRYEDELIEWRVYQFIYQESSRVIKEIEIPSTTIEIHTECVGTRTKVRRKRVQRKYREEKTIDKVTPEILEKYIVEDPKRREKLMEEMRKASSVELKPGVLVRVAPRLYVGVDDEGRLILYREED